jgi:type II secretion system protein C
MQMFDSPTLQERVHRHGPRLISIALTGLIVAECARASMSLFGAHPGPAMVEPQRPSHAMRRQQIDIQKIASAHLFGTVVDPGMQDPTPTTANLVLTGTIATQDPNHGVAIINGDDAPAKVYRAGQEVSGALLRSVYLDHVLLDRNGSLEILALPKLTSGVSLKLTSGASRISRAAALTAQSTPASDAPPAQDDDLLQIAPAVLGTTRGFRVMGGKEFAALRASGLRRSDIVTAINGTPLHDQDSFQQSINEIQSGAAVLTILRNGHPTDINVNVND